MGIPGGRLLAAMALGAALVACSGAADVASGGARPARSTVGSVTTAGASPTLADSSTPGTSVPTAGGPAWGSCARFARDFALTDLLGLDRSRIQCATLRVPLRYDESGGTTIDLAIARLPARLRSERLGSLVVNPGGPGGSGLEFLPQFALEATDDLLDRFDIVSFDPRGVAASTPISCLTDAERDAAQDRDPRPASEAERLSALDQAVALNVRCVRSAPDLVPRMGTMNVARDLDRLRAALGDDRLTYLGFSYGTRIGAVYAGLFPDRVRALVLDGAVSPDSSPTVLRDGQLEGFRRAFARFSAGCAAHPTCPLVNVRDAITRLIARAAAHPIATFDSRPLTVGRVYAALAASMYDAAVWPDVWQGIDQALAGSGAVLGLLSDVYAGRRTDGTWSNASESFTAVMCADTTARPTRSDTEPRSREIIGADVLWGPVFADQGLLCDGTASAVDPVPAPLRAPDAPPIVVIGTTNDPATPFEWAQQMAAALPSAVLVTHDGDGHTAYGTSACVTDLVGRYLLSATPPSGPQTCSD